MYRKLAFVNLEFIIPVPFSSRLTIAHTVLEKVAKTGVVTVGTSKDAFPFEYPEGVDVVLVERAIANTDHLDMIRKVRARSHILIS